MPDTADIQEADRVLHAHRSWKACYPCAKRKVKCTGIYPCSTCIERGHPGICIVEPHRKARRRAGDSSADSSRPNKRQFSTGTSITTPTLPNSPVPESAASIESQSSSAYNITRTPSEAAIYMPSPARTLSDAERLTLPLRASTNPPRITTSEDRLSSDHRPAPALSTTNVFGHWEGRPPTDGDSLQSINDMIPNHADLLKFSNIYQDIFAPYFPLLPDSDDVEAIIRKFLERAAMREISGFSVFPSGPSKTEISEASIMLAILARGVQLSDLKRAARVKRSREYARRAFHLARMANFMLSPSVNTIQSLLLIQYILQNDGQQEQAWCMVGFVVRLAMSIGLHTDSHPSLPVKEQVLRARIWAMLVRQDASLSQCLDRPPTNLRPAHLFRRKRSISTTLEHGQFIDELVGWSNTLMEQPPETRDSVDGVLAQIAELDRVRSRSAPHLQSREQCHSRQSLIFYHFTWLNHALAMTIACRSALKGQLHPERIPSHAHVLDRLRQSLKDSLQCFLDLSRLTILPLRQWNYVHLTISCALLIEFGPLGPVEPETQAVLAQFVHVVNESLKDDDENEPSATEDETAGPAYASVRALRTIQQSMKKRQDAAYELAMMSNPHVGLPSEVAFHPPMRYIQLEPAMAPSQYPSQSVHPVSTTSLPLDVAGDDMATSHMGNDFVVYPGHDYETIDWNTFFTNNAAHAASMDQNLWL